MKVDFNTLRKQAVDEYNALVRVLNKSISRAVCGYSLRLEVEDVEEILNDLRMSIGIIALTYEDKNPEFINVLGDGELMLFNPDNNEVV